MFIAYLVVTAITMLAVAWSAAGVMAKMDSILANIAEVGVPQSWLPILVTLKFAGVAGLLLGLLGVPFIGIAAAAGLVLFFIGAIVTHVRAHVLYNIAFPGSYLALTAASLVLALVR